MTERLTHLMEMLGAAGTGVAVAPAVAVFVGVRSSERRKERYALGG
ncbi:hypothetical protein ACFYSC_18135 [Streptosporangium sp. NPDC004379]